MMAPMKKKIADVSLNNLVIILRAVLNFEYCFLFLIMEISEKTWCKLLNELRVENHIVTSLWKEIYQKYSSKGRYYHSIGHINQMLNSAIRFKDKILDVNNVLFAIFYHDVIYSSTKSDNEEKSADFAEKHLRLLKYSEKKIQKCKNYIIATKSHLNNDEDPDLNYFLDFDLEKLGASWNEYEEYTKQIRQEYKIYPKPLYNKGRKKVLQHFLSQQRIYKSEDFFELYEKQARENLQKELSVLS